MSAVVQVYTLGTPNPLAGLLTVSSRSGLKTAIALEELGLPHQNHIIDISKGDQFKPEFLAINPNNKIPAIVDPNGPDGKPLTVFESGAILIYLAEKAKSSLLPSDPVERIHTIQWLMFQMAGVGPMFGQFGHFFKYAKEKIPYAIERYTNEARRIAGVLDKQLADHPYIVGEHYTIADIATAPWFAGVILHYNGTETLKFDEFKNVAAWLKRVLARPAVLKAYQSFNIDLQPVLSKL